MQDFEIGDRVIARRNHEHGQGLSEYGRAARERANGQCHRVMAIYRLGIWAEREDTGEGSFWQPSELTPAPAVDPSPAARAIAAIEAEVRPRAEAAHKLSCPVAKHGAAPQWVCRVCHATRPDGVSASEQSGPPGHSLTITPQAHDRVNLVTPHVATLPDGSTVNLPAGTVLREGMTWDGPPADPLRDLLTALKANPDPALAAMISKLVTQIESGSIPLLSQARALLRRARPWIAPGVPDIANPATEAQPAATVGALRAEIDAFLAGLPVAAPMQAHDPAAEVRLAHERLDRANAPHPPGAKLWERIAFLDAERVLLERGRRNFEPTAEEVAACPMLSEVSGKPEREVVLALANEVAVLREDFNKLDAAARCAAAQPTQSTKPQRPRVGPWVEERGGVWSRFNEHGALVGTAAEEESGASWTARRAFAAPVEGLATDLGAARDAADAVLRKSFDLGDLLSTLEDGDASSVPDRALLEALYQLRQEALEGVSPERSKAIRDRFLAVERIIYSEPNLTDASGR